MNVLLVLAPDGSRSPSPPQHPLRLLLLPSRVSPTKAASADTQPPGSARVRVSETRAELGAGSIYLFFLKAGGSSLAWHTLLMLGMPPCLPWSVQDEKRRLSPDAGAFPGTSPESQYVFPGAPRASTALGTTQDLPGVGKSLCGGWRG